MNGRSRGIKRTIVASILFLVAVLTIQIATGVGAMMLRRGLSFCSKTTITTTTAAKTTIRSTAAATTTTCTNLPRRPSFLFLQTPDTTNLWSNPHYCRTFATTGSRCRLSTRTNATATAIRAVSSFAPSPIAALTSTPTSTAPTVTTTISKMPKRKGKTKFYAVARGHTPGIYSSWDECQTQVRGYPNVKFKSFATSEEAESYIATHQTQSSSTSDSLPQVDAVFSGMAASMATTAKTTTNTTKRQRVGGGGTNQNATNAINSTNFTLPPRAVAANGTAAAASARSPGTLWSSLHNDDSSEYVPPGSFTRYVERNMERPEVRNDPVAKRRVEAEIDKLLSEVANHTVNWNRVPLIALPAEPEPKPDPVPTKQKASATATETKQAGAAAAADTSGSRRTTNRDAPDSVPTRSKTKTESYDDENDNDENETATDLPRAVPHKLFYHVMFDGGSRGNPSGHAGAGTYVLTRSFYHSEEALTSTSKSKSKSKPKTIISQDKASIRTYLGLGKLTNNQAEYQGLVTGLEHVREALQNATSTQRSSETLDTVTVFVQGDSDLIIKQMKGVYACKSPKLKSYHKRALDLVKAIRKDCARSKCKCEITFEHVYREDNTIADKLANEAMDGKRSWTTTTATGLPSAPSRKGTTTGGDGAVEV